MGKVALTLGITIRKEAIESNLKRIINQTYKLLPLREQGKDWQKPLQTLIEQIVGMSNLIEKQDELFFSILCKMKGLTFLTEEYDMILYRRTILELLSLLGILKNNVC